MKGTLRWKPGSVFGIMVRGLTLPYRGAYIILCKEEKSFDEPSTGMHPRDVHRMSRLLKNLRDKGNTVLVVEHDKDIISIADEVIDIGPLAGKNGGQILFQGSYEALLLSETRTGKALCKETKVKEKVRKAKRIFTCTRCASSQLEKCGC